MSFIRDYYSLIQLTRTYLLQEIKEEKIIRPKVLPEKKKGEVPMLAPVIVERPSLPSPPLSNAVPPPEIEKEEITFVSLVKEENMAVEEMKGLLQKIAPSSFHQQPITPVMIVAPGDKREEIEFLTKMAQALTPLYGEASVISAHKIEKNRAGEALFSSSLLKLLIAPLSFTKEFPKLMSKAKEMQLSPLSSKSYLFSIGEISSYLHDLKLKRTLWNALKGIQLNR